MRQRVSKLLGQVQQRFIRHKNPVHDEVKSQARFDRGLKNNPYLQSKAIWNDLYGNVQLKLENSYRIILALCGALLLTVLGLVIVAGETTVKPVPFIIHGNELISSTQMLQAGSESIKPALSFYFVRSFIDSARSVSADRIVNANNKMKALAVCNDAAEKVLEDFFDKNSPDRIAEHHTKSIQITSILRESPATVDVRWKEEWRDTQSGTLIDTKRYIARISYSYKTPSQNQRILAFNPMGFAINYLSWSEEKH